MLKLPCLQCLKGMTAFKNHPQCLLTLLIIRILIIIDFRNFPVKWSRLMLHKEKKQILVFCSANIFWMQTLYQTFEISHWITSWFFLWNCLRSSGCFKELSPHLFHHRSRIQKSQILTQGKMKSERPGSNHLYFLKTTEF